MKAILRNEFRKLSKRDFDNGAVLDEIDVALEQRQTLLRLCGELIEAHDLGEWGDSTGSYEPPCKPLQEIGELGTVIDRIRWVLTEFKK